MSNWYVSHLEFRASAEDAAAIRATIADLYDPAWTDLSIQGNTLYFRTPRVPDYMTFDRLAEQFPNAEFWYTYYDSYCYTCAGMKYSDGMCVHYTSGCFGPDPMEEEDVHPYPYYEENRTNRVFYRINGVWTDPEGKAVRYFKED